MNYPINKNTKKNRIKSLKELFNSFYLKLFKINDTPHKIALGLGLGVSLGILPGTGPIAALFLALALRLNRASALLGSLLTNTWLSFVTFFLSIKLGSAIMGSDWQRVYNDWLLFIRNFRWFDLFKLSLIKIILPVIIGYSIVALCLGLLVYLVSFIIIIWIRHVDKSRINISW